MLYQTHVLNWPVNQQCTKLRFPPTNYLKIKLNTGLQLKWWFFLLVHYFLKWWCRIKNSSTFLVTTWPLLFCDLLMSIDKTSDTITSFNSVSVWLSDLIPFNLKFCILLTTHSRESDLEIFFSWFSSPYTKVTSFFLRHRFYW